MRYLFYVCRSSVTRMSSDQKQNVITKTSEEERATLDANLSHLSSSREEEEKTPVTSPTTQDAETGTWRLHSHHTSAAAVGHSGFKFDWIVLLYSISFESSLFLSFFCGALRITEALSPVMACFPRSDFAAQKFQVWACSLAFFISTLWARQGLLNMSLWVAGV